jgi:hypothetical protein
MTPKSLSLKPKALARLLALVALVLVLASVAGQVSKYFLGHDYLKGFVPLFDLDGEGNIPTFFSVLLILLAALLQGLLARLDRQRDPRQASMWLILSFGFLLMAYDEAFSVHEGLSTPVRDLLGGGSLVFFHYAWTIPALLLVLVLGLIFLRFWLHLPAPTRAGSLLAAALYLGGAIGIELLGGLHDSIHLVNDFTYTMIAALEESLEMAGLIVFIRVLLDHLAGGRKEMRVSVGQADVP